MGRMVRKQVYIEARQEELLKRRAQTLGVTEAELIRRGIDALHRASLPTPPDPDAWDEAMAVMEERLRLDVPQTGRGWTREELYDERLDRLAR